MVSLIRTILHLVLRNFFFFCIFPFLRKWGLTWWGPAFVSFFSWLDFVLSAMEKEPLSVGGGRSDAGPSTFRPTEKLEIPPSHIDEDLFWQEVMNSAEEKREAAPTPAIRTGRATAHRSPLARVSRHVQGAREAHRADPPSSENGWNAYPGRKAHGALGRHDRGRAWGNAKSSAYPLGYAEQRPGESFLVEIPHLRSNNRKNPTKGTG